jgi:hypothetical protein
MIRLVVGARVGKTLQRLGPEVAAETEKQLLKVAAQFGQPHQHSGLGLRKLGPRSYEIRVWRQWRVVFIQDGETLFAFDVMNHDEVELWLKRKR